MGKRGPKPKGPVAKTAIITIRMRADLRGQIERIAKERGRSMSTVIHDLLWRVANQDEWET